MRERSVDVDGAKLWLAEHGAGPPLLLLHGFTGSHADFRHLLDIDELSAQYRVLTPDARGHGRSGTLEGAFVHRQCARDVLAILDALQIDRVRALGISGGGNTLLHAATMAPSRIEAMVTVGAPSYFPEQARAIMRTFTEDSRTEDDWSTMRQRHPGGDDQIRALWAAAREFADSHDDMDFTPPKLATITARTLITTGDRDPLYPVEIFVEQYRAIPGAQLCVLPGAGHDAVFGPAREFFVQTALRFLRSA